MSMFWCAYHERDEDSDAVGFVESEDGEMICEIADDKIACERSEWENATLSMQRELMGGANGGDGDDD